jgi:hypothetical protein
MIQAPSGFRDPKIRIALIQNAGFTSGFRREISETRPFSAPRRAARLVLLLRATADTAL